MKRDRSQTSGGANPCPTGCLMGWSGVYDPTSAAPDDSIDAPPGACGVVAPEPVGGP
jgi:hypothetical protein